MMRFNPRLPYHSVLPNQHNPEEEEGRDEQALSEVVHNQHPWNIEIHGQHLYRGWGEGGREGGRGAEWRKLGREEGREEGGEGREGKGREARNKGREGGEG